MDIKYYDIGLNLFSKQFRNPEDIIKKPKAKTGGLINWNKYKSKQAGL